MNFQILFASLRSLRITGLALLLALLCAAPLSRSARADDAPVSGHIYLYDDLIGFTDVTSTFDGDSVVSVFGDVVYVTFATSAGQHTTEFATSAGQHTTELVIDNDTSEIVGIVAP